MTMTRADKGMMFVIFNPDVKLGHTTRILVPSSKRGTISEYNNADDLYKSGSKSHDGETRYYSMAELIEPNGKIKIFKLGETTDNKFIMSIYEDRNNRENIIIDYIERNTYYVRIKENKEYTLSESDISDVREDSNGNIISIRYIDWYSTQIITVGKTDIVSREKDRNKRGFKSTCVKSIKKECSEDRWRRHTYYTVCTETEQVRRKCKDGNGSMIIDKLYYKKEQFSSLSKISTFYKSIKLNGVRYRIGSKFKTYSEKMFYKIYEIYELSGYAYIVTLDSTKNPGLEDSTKVFRYKI